MRLLGDIYVKQEFRQHHTSPNVQYYGKFYDEWLKYYQQLSAQGVKGVSRPLDDGTQKLLNKDQK